LSIDIYEAYGVEQMIMCSPVGKWCDKTMEQRLSKELFVKKANPRAKIFRLYRLLYTFQFSKGMPLPTIDLHQLPVQWEPFSKLLTLWAKLRKVWPLCYPRHLSPPKNRQLMPPPLIFQ